MGWVLCALLAGILAGFLRKRDPYPENVLWAKDVTWASITGSPKKQTISDFIGDKARAGRLWARSLNWVFRGHFTATEEDRVRTGFWATSLGMLLGAVVMGFWLYALWTWPKEVIRYVAVPFYAFLLAWLLTQQAGKLLSRTVQGSRLAMAQERASVPRMTTAINGLLSWVMSRPDAPRWVVIVVVIVLGAMFLLGWDFLRLG